MIRWVLKKTDLHVVGHHAGVHGSSAGSKSGAEFVSEGVKARTEDVKTIQIMFTYHNVLFVQYVLHPTEYAESYLEICFLIFHLTFVPACSVGRKT